MSSRLYRVKKLQNKQIKINLIPGKFWAFERKEKGNMGLLTWCIRDREISVFCYKRDALKGDL
jgi:hypothetical protein